MSTGTWFKKPRPRPVHECDYPEFVLRDVGEDILPGDRYQCECGKVWEVTTKNDAEAYGSKQGAWHLFYKEVHAPGVMNDTRIDRYDRYNDGHTYDRT